jgi:enoyl-CoA hydratase/carnithine racemase
VNKFELITVDIQDRVALVTMNRAPVNALNKELCKELTAAFLELKDDPEVRAVVVTSSCKTFIAGADIAFMKGIAATKDEAEMLHYDRGLQFCNSILEDMPKPTIAAVNGIAMGGGMELALCCDFRFMADNVTMGLPEIKLGLLPGAGGIQKMVRLVGKTKALRAMLQAHDFTAQECLELGLVEEVCPPDKLLDTAMAFAKDLASRAPIAVAEIKKCVIQAQDLPRDASLLADVKGLGVLFMSEDAEEGLKAFLEKRQAIFKGK